MSGSRDRLGTSNLFLFNNLRRPSGGLSRRPAAGKCASNRVHFHEYLTACKREGIAMGPGRQRQSRHTTVFRVLEIADRAERARRVGGRLIR